MFYDLRMNLKNKLIRKLVAHTPLYASTVYDVLWKYSYEEVMTYAKQIKEAREESGCYYHTDYQKWFEENKLPQLKKQWAELDRKLARMKEEEKNSLTF